MYIPPGYGHAASYNNQTSIYDPSTRIWSWSVNRTPCADVRESNIDKAQGRYLSNNMPIGTHTYDLVATVGEEILVAAQVQGRGKGCNNLIQSGAPGYEYIIASGSFRFYNPSTDVWRFTNIPARDYKSAIEIEPSGDVIIVDSTSVQRYNVSAGTFVTLMSFKLPGMGSSAELIRAANTGRYYWIGQNKQTGFGRDVYEIDVDARTIVTHGVIPDGAGHGFAYGNGKIVGGLKNGAIYTYDPVTGGVAEKVLTETPCGGPLATHGYAWVYSASINGFVGRIFRGACNRTIEYR